MIFEFLLTCGVTPETDIRQALTGSLAEALENSQNEFDEDAVNDWIQLRHERARGISVDDEETVQHRIIGFSVELPEEIVPNEEIIKNFIKNLSDSEFHIVKFEDPLLQTKLAERAKEIFDLEMKLRRVLSIIYLPAYQSEDPYNLLRDEKTKTITLKLQQNQVALLGGYSDVATPPPTTSPDATARYALLWLGVGTDHRPPLH